MDRAELIEIAIGINENYRTEDSPIMKDLEIGFLYGCAEMILTLTLREGESYSEMREVIANEIDHRVGNSTYRVLKD